VVVESWSNLKREEAHILPWMVRYASPIIDTTIPMVVNISVDRLEPTRVVPRVFCRDKLG
jgi:hypothetical protein